MPEEPVATIDPEGDSDPTSDHLGGVPPFPPNTTNISDSESSDSSSSDLDSSYNMARNNHLGDDDDQSWLAQDVVAVPKFYHPLPKHPEKVLPIFNPDEKQSAEDHVKQFIMKV